MGARGCDSPGRPDKPKRKDLSRYKTRSEAHLTALILRDGWELSPYWEESGRSFPRRAGLALAGSRLGEGCHPAEAGRVRSAARHIGDIQLRYATLIGQALDGPGILADADARYFILEGTREPPSPKPRPSR